MGWVRMGTCAYTHAQIGWNYFSWIQTYYTHKYIRPHGFKLRKIKSFKTVTVMNVHAKHIEKLDNCIWCPKQSFPIIKLSILLFYQTFHCINWSQNWKRSHNWKRTINRYLEGKMQLDQFGKYISYTMWAFHESSVQQLRMALM